MSASLPETTRILKQLWNPDGAEGLLTDIAESWMPPPLGWQGTEQDWWDLLAERRAFEEEQWLVN